MTQFEEGKLYKVGQSPLLSRQSAYPYLIPSAPKTIDLSSIVFTPDGNSHYIPNTPHQKQAQIQSYWGTWHYCSDSSTNMSRGNLDRFLSDPDGDLISWTARNKTADQYRSQIASYGWHSEVIDEVHYSAERHIGLKFQIRLEGSDISRTKGKMQIIEMIMHYTDPSKPKTFKNVKIYPGGKSSSLSAGGITFRNSYDKKEMYDKFGEIDDSWKTVYAFTENKEIQGGTWMWCGLTFAVWCPVDSKELYFKARIKNMCPIHYLKNITYSDTSGLVGFYSRALKGCITSDRRYGEKPIHISEVTE